MTCRHDVRKVNIDDDLLSEDKAVVEDLVAAAVNDAVRKVESTTQEKMSGLTAGMGSACWNESAILTNPYYQYVNCPRHRKP